MLLWKQNEHRSAFISRTETENIICSYRHSMSEPHPLIVPILEEVGFSGVANLRHLKVDHALITALVERWRPETHTFRFPTGECTIRLEDVAAQLGLRVDGLPVIGPTLYDWEEMCSTYLGIVPVKDQGLITFRMIR
ncbi:serine/threonine-protein phosphatase 7 long form homolog [Cajanus cajan]|uniref:serine/threonine-protein phosphatase 7 long form homolog n=1 Tax=Cajanus cajan TaxID=3821 RepID=UPI00098DD3A2|nr:serine/threonine-protein phosphatase 7 long form homolog [Cajanus cajan]